ncbi:MAG: hypothetical protein KME26_01285 [Oscillatoria princeps RMCB-10]|nr:hypothetical protein [Oscillatoria princeps RMCB-10]
MGRLSYVRAEFFLKTQPGGKRFTLRHRQAPPTAGTPPPAPRSITIASGVTFRGNTDWQNS